MDLNYIEYQIESLKDSHNQMWKNIVQPTIVTPGFGLDAKIRITAVSDILDKTREVETISVDTGTLACLVLMAEFGLNHAVIRGAEEKLQAQRSSL